MRSKKFDPHTTEPQVDAFGQTYTPAGNCASCSRRVFVVTDEHRTNDEPDPRGFAGPRHSLTTFEDIPGPRFCWDCVNEHGSDGYQAARAVARKSGVELTPEQVASVKDRMSRGGSSEAKDIIAACSRIVVWFEDRES
jgi:hypothetical protein